MQPAPGKGGEGKQCISNARAHHPRKHPRNCSHMLALTALASLEPQIPFSTPGAAVQPSPAQTCLSSPALNQERAAPVPHHGPVNPVGPAGNFQHTLKLERKMMDPGLYWSPGPSLSFLPLSSSMNIYPLAWAEYLYPRLGCLHAGRRHRHSCRNSSFSRHRVQPGAGARGRQPFSFPIPPSSMESKHCSSHKGGYCRRMGGGGESEREEAWGR